MSLSSILYNAASHRTGGVRSFPASSDEPVWLKYAYNAPDQGYAKLFFRHIGGHNRIQPAAAAKPAAGWVIPDNEDCSPVFVAHSVLAAIWLLREMLPAALSQSSWMDLVDAAQALAGQSKTPSPPPSTQRPAAVLMEDSDSSLGAGAGAEFDSESDQDPVQSRKRKTPSASLQPTPKRVCTPALTASPAPSDESPSSSTPYHVVTVTNNNRRSNVRIQKNILRAQEKRRLDLGLHPPSKSASLAERQAYSSVAPTDAQHISWLFKQPIGKNGDLYHNASSPYQTTIDMLTKARAVGHQDTWRNAASFLSSWRQHGTPFSSKEPARLSRPLPWAYVPSHSPDDMTFQYAWKMCDYYEGQLASAVIKYRWAMALLGRVYDNKIAQLKGDNHLASRARSRNRYGRGQVRTEAIDSLLRTAIGNTPSKEQRRAFRQRLSRANRWYDAVTTLGWGILCLMPFDAISNKWAEKTLTRPQWDVWLQLVEKIQPDACTASRKLDAWLGAEGIEGGPIQDKEPLCIEAGPAAIVGEVEEVADSDLESESGRDSDGEDATAGTPHQPLRQLTLLELFAPNEQDTLCHRDGLLSTTRSVM
jgi:hypothetical protein